MTADQQPERRKLRLITEPAREDPHSAVPETALGHAPAEKPAAPGPGDVAPDRRPGGGTVGETLESASAFGYPAEEAGPEPAFDEMTEDTPDGGDETRSRGRFWPAIGVLFALGAFGGVVWYAYTWDEGAVEVAELPVVRAEPGPIKSRPEDPGGLEVPYQDQLVLNEPTPDPDRPQVERLLPPPETPLPPAALTAPPPPPAESAAEPEAVTTEAGPAAGPAADDTDAAPAEPEALPAAPADESIAEAEPVPAAPAPLPEPAPAAEAPAAPAAAAPSPPTESQTAARTPESAPSASAPAAGDFVVQLASLKQRAGVEVEWTRLQKAYPDLLGTKRLRVEQVDLGTRGTFYRVQAGFFAERAGAEALCAQLKARQQDCLVSRR